MKWVQLVVVLATAFFFGRVAFSADTESEKQFNQLKINIENSEKNKEAYEKNQKISEQNVKAIDENLKALEVQKKQILENTKKADQNVKTMEKQDQQIKVLIKKEEDQIEVENKQIADLEAKIAKIKENIAKRQANIGEYNIKSKAIITEKDQWTEQKTMAQGLEKTIDEKQKQAQLDRADWKKKAEGYAAEVKKWRTEADTNKSIQKKYNQLNK